jgi:HAD superfamily hydrolase (TIGR01662 family)
MNVDQELIREAVAVFFSYEERLWRAYPDACATLQRLSEAGYLLGLVSNASDDGLIQRLVDRLDFRRWLRPVLSSAGVGIRKPNPKILQMVLSQWGLPPQQAVMVGDRLEFDILGARLAGMRSVLVSKGEDPDEAEQRGGIAPDAQIEHLSELPEIIATL